MFEAIYHVKSMSRKKPSYKNILSRIQKPTASNIDFEAIEESVSDMVAKKILDKDFRILNESCNSFTLQQISDADVETLYLDTLNNNILEQENSLLRSEIQNKEE